MLKVEHVACTGLRNQRGGVHLLEDLEGGVKPVKKGTMNGKALAKVQGVEDEPWRNEGVGSLEEVLPRPKRTEPPKKAARCYKVTTRVGGDGFTPKGATRRVKRNKGRTCGAPREGGAVWKVAANKPARRCFS